MKKIVMILMIAAAMLLSAGCANDEYYPVAKKIYAGGKVLVEANADKLSDSTLEKLKKVDKAAKTIDDAKSTIEGK